MTKFFNGLSLCTARAHSQAAAAMKCIVPVLSVAAGLCASAHADEDVNGPLQVAQWQAPALAPAPVCINFTPKVGMPGAAVTITGQNLVNVRSVTFREVAAEFRVVSTSSIWTSVPDYAEAGSNPIVVTTANGVARCPGSFNVHPGKQPLP